MIKAIVSLLGSLEKGLAGDRIKALRSLRNEVFLSSPTFYQKNTARVLLQIMKELVRSSDNEMRQLKLTHDFRIVSTGNPCRIRKELANYHLVEMPKEWNQFAFDDHVHDANTKGRKSPTHLVMDARIKGIRHLAVVYYNYVRPEVIEELVEASAILDIQVKVAIEFSARFRDKYARFTWEPDVFNDNQSFLKFLKEDAVNKLLDEGREVSQYQQKYVFDVLGVFNERHRTVLNKELKLSIPPLKSEEFQNFVGTGQPSIPDLARFIHNTLIGDIKETYSAHFDKETATESKIDVEFTDKINGLNVEAIINNYLLPSHNLEVHDPAVPQDCPDLPQLLQFSLGEILRDYCPFIPVLNLPLILATSQPRTPLSYSIKGPE